MLFDARKIVSTSLAIMLSGCTTTGEEIVGAAVTVPMYVIVAVPAAVTYPFWKSAAEARKADHLPKRKEQISNKLGTPKTKYLCNDIEVWEYGNNDKKEYFFLHEPGKEFEITDVSNLDHCTVVEGRSGREVASFWIAEALPCGMNYKKQIHDRDIFFIDLKQSRGTIQIKHSVFRPGISTGNARFDVRYEGEIIYDSPFVSHPFKRRENDVEVVDATFGPGNVSFLEVRVNSKPSRLLFTRYYYDLWISCPY